MPVTTADGKLTKVFINTAYHTMRDLQRGIVAQNAKEEIFKIDHRQYIDQLLVDMEATKKERHAKRMLHWKKSKANVGFASSFESAFGDSSDWPPLANTAAQSNEDFPSFPLTPAHIPGDGIASAVLEFGISRQRTGSGATGKNGSSKLRVRIDESGGGGSRAVEERSLGSFNSLHSNSVHSMNSSAGGSSAGFSRPGTNSKKIKNHSRMALFNSLLEVTEPPKSPTKRFGSLAFNNNNPESEKSITMSQNLSRSQKSYDSLRK